MANRASFRQDGAPPALLDSHAQESDEVGYLFLENGDVKIASDGEIKGTPPTRTWIDVEWETAKRNTLAADTCAKARNDCVEGSFCSHCNLVLLPIRNESDGTVNRLVLKNAPHFDGTLADLICGSSCPEHRSDGALLTGVTFTCQEHGYVAIRSIKVLFFDDRFEKTSLVITFSMPALTREGQKGKRSIVPTTNISARKKSVTKPLPPSVQLLLTIVRSDWNFLDKEMTRLEKSPTMKDISTLSDFVLQMESDGSLKKRRRTMFPQKLSLEELYLRLPGVTTSELDSESNASSSLLVSLPRELVVTFIAPFLPARSLDALRLSCKLFHHCMRNNIPGMKLQLYAHQIRSLEWMRRRETKELSEEEVLSNELNIFGEECVNGDMYRAVTGGASTCLRLRDSGNVYRINQQTGNEVTLKANEPRKTFALSRRLSRGGLLCDDPGLGKTVTVLSLILQTSGLSTLPIDESSSKADSALSHTDDDIFQAYWNDHVPYLYRRGSFVKMLNTLRKQNVDIGMFELPVDPVRDCCPDYLDIIDRPISIGEIEKLINEEYTFQEFQEDVIRCFRNAITFNPADHPVHMAADKLLKAFTTLVDEFKAKQVQTAKKSFSKATAKPNSSVAALLEKRHQEELLDALKPTAGNLLVVPSTLLNHWEEQLKLHVDWKYITNKVPLIYHYDGNRQTEVSDLCQIQKTHFPCVFIDKAPNKPLPTADFLAMFRIVLTTTQRLTNEWKNGSFEDELQQDKGSKKYSAYYYEVGGDDSRSACPLLKVNWFRLIVDEGHSMGRGSSNSAILFASWISAQRRWAMTGTPTPQTASSSGLSNLKGLMRFLQHDFFSLRLEGDTIWQGSIVRSWNSGNLAAFFRLHSLLSLLMVRHTKLDIDELPPPNFRTTMLTMSADEVASYNALVSVIMSNLQITSMEGLTSGRQDSLLFPAQSRNAREAFTNVRLVCSGRCGLYPTISDDNQRDLIEMVKGLGLTVVRLKLIKNFLYRVVNEELSGCNMCGLQIPILLLIPCGHFVCVDCFDNKMSSCAICQEVFDVDVFQRLQPGIELQWHSPEEINMMNAQESIARNVNEEAVQVPDSPRAINVADRVALQPAPARRRTRRPGDGHSCEYDVASSEGKCILCLEEHFDCILLGKSRCDVCYKAAQECPDYESKSFYLSKSLHELRLKYPSTVVSTSVVTRRPLKAIVFSEFRSTLDLVGDRLLRQFGGGCIAEYWGKTRDAELLKFAKSPDCFCMLLGRTGSEGLDLSFVTHIFFLEKIWDKSLESQAISRSWRMGAKGACEVETLIARDSMEATMMGMEASTFGDYQDGESSSTKERQRAKLLFLLQSLKLIRQPNTAQQTNGTKKRPRVASSDASLTTGSTNDVDGEESQTKKAARVRFQD